MLSELGCHIHAFFIRIALNEAEIFARCNGNALPIPDFSCKIDSLHIISIACHEVYSATLGTHLRVSHFSCQKSSSILAAVPEKNNNIVSVRTWPSNRIFVKFNRNFDLDPNNLRPTMS